MYAENELMFPHHALPSLRRLRGPHWQSLVERVMRLPETHVETLALMLMVIRLNGCMGCETDSYRAMKGCSACALQTLRRYKGDDQELLMLFTQAVADVTEYAKLNPNAGVIMSSIELEAAVRPA